MQKTLQLYDLPTPLRTHCSHHDVIFRSPQNHRTHDGRTPLIAACLSGHTEMAALLISHGAELDSDLDQTMSPLFCAAEEGHTRTTQLLLSRGADPHRALKVRNVIVYPRMTLQRGGSMGGFLVTSRLVEVFAQLFTLNDQGNHEGQAIVSMA